MLVAPSAIADRHRDQHDPPVEQRRRALPAAAPRSAPAVSPAWSAALRSRIAPAWPTRPCPVRGDLQGMVPPVMLHGEERSSPGICCVW